MAHNTMFLFGSNSPVEISNPFAGIHVAATRHRVDGPPSAQGWYPEEWMPLNQILYACTAAPVNSSGFGERLGVLSNGSFADLIVLKLAPFEIQAQDLHLI